MTTISHSEFIDEFFEGNAESFYEYMEGDNGELSETGSITLKLIDNDDKLRTIVVSLSFTEIFGE
jgi:hypothetical protein